MLYAMLEDFRCFEGLVYSVACLYLFNQVNLTGPNIFDTASGTDQSLQVSLDAFKKTYDSIMFSLAHNNTNENSEETISKQDRIIISIDENNSSADKEDIAELLEIDGEPIYEDVKVGKLILMAYTNLRYISAASSNNIRT